MKNATTVRPHHSTIEPATDTWLGRRFGGMPTGFWVLVAGAGMARIGWFVIPFRVFYLSHERQLDATDCSLVMAAFGAGWALSQPFGGWCADRIGRKTVIIAGAWCSAAAFLAFGSARSLGGLAVTACVAGLCFEVHRPATQALTAESVTIDRRDRALALLYLVMNVSRTVACLMAGLLAAQAFWALFVINAIVNIGFGIAAQHAIRDPAPARNTVAPRRLRAALTDPALLGFTAITLAFYSILLQSAVTLPVVMDHAGASPIAFGLVLALDPLAVALMQLFLQSWLTPDFPGAVGRCSASLLVCALGAATVGIGLAITGTGTSVAWFAATTPIWVVGEVAFLTVAPGIVAFLAPAQLRGLYFGVWGCCQGAAAVTAPLLAALLISAGGTSLLWHAGAIGGLVTALACLTLRASTIRRLATTAVRAW